MVGRPALREDGGTPRTHKQRGWYWGTQEVTHVSEESWWIEFGVSIRCPEGCSRENVNRDEIQERCLTRDIIVGTGACGQGGSDWVAAWDSS